MPDFSNQINSNAGWIDELLVKDLSGHLKPYHQSKSAPIEASVSYPPETVLEIAPSHELVNFDTAPADASFDFFHNGQAQHEPAIFVFHPDDHAQTESLMANLPVDASKKYSLEKIAQRIVEKNNLVLDKNNQELFNNILLDFFRNRKNYVITREYLVAKLLSNGHNVSHQVIDHMGSIIKGLKERIEAEGGLVVRQSAIKETSAVVKNEIKPEIKVFEPIKVATPIVEEKLPDLPKEKEINIRVKTEPEEAMVDTPSFPKVNRLTTPLPEKPRVSDVVNKPNIVSEKVKNVLTGPVQELENLLLSTFRRYGNNATERTQKLLQKINVLEKDSVTKKTAGIAAWRKSPVFKLYLDLGAGSLLKNQEISQLIAERKTAGQDVLTVEEFQAIGDLNKLLRF
jgi:hypothetical protein